MQKELQGMGAYGPWAGDVSCLKRNSFISDVIKFQLRGSCVGLGCVLFKKEFFHFRCFQVSTAR